MSKRKGLPVLFLLITAACLPLLVYASTKTADLSPAEARKIIARMAGIELPSSAVRVREVSTMGSSAVVVAQVETAFRFSRGEDGKWRVAEIRTGDNRWEDVELLVRALNAEKGARAQAEMEVLATALEAFKRERGFYVAADNVAALVDHLNPRYLKNVIRRDPWHNPYLYEGTSEGYRLSSPGPDGKPGTADDLSRK